MSDAIVPEITIQLSPASRAASPIGKQPTQTRPKKRSSLLVKQPKETPLENTLVAYKNAIETESFALATSLSPGIALQAMMNIPQKPCSSLQALASKVTVASIPLPLSQETLQNYEKQVMSKMTGRKHRKSFVGIPSGVLGGGESSQEEAAQCDNPTYFSDSEESIKPIVKHKKKTLWDKIKEAKPKIPVQKKPIVEVILPEEEKEMELLQKRSDAIVNLLELKRKEYHEQARKEIEKHLETSKARLARLERSLKLSTEQKAQQELELKLQRKKVLPETLINGAKNDFPVPEEYKTSWYESVSKVYVNKRGTKKEVADVEAKELVEQPVTNPVKEEHKIPVVNRKPKRTKELKMSQVESHLFAAGIKGVPPMNSLTTDINFSEQSNYFFEYLTQKQNPAKDKAATRKFSLERMTEQVIRNKHISQDTMNRHQLQTAIQTPPLERKETDEHVIVNILDDEEILEIDNDGKFIQRRRQTMANVTRKLSQGDNVDGKEDAENTVTPSPKRNSSLLVSPDSRRSFLGRKSFVADESAKLVRLSSTLEEETEEKNSKTEGPSRQTSFNQNPRDKRPLSRGSTTTSSVPSSSTSLANLRDSVFLSPLLNRKSLRRITSETSKSSVTKEQQEISWLSDTQEAHDTFIIPVNDGSSEFSSVEPDFALSKSTNNSLNKSQKKESRLVAGEPKPSEPVVSQKQRIIEPLTWNEMLVQHQPKVPVLEKNRVFKWVNPALIDTERL